MDMQKIISLAESNIRTALADYARHTCDTQVMDDVCEEFIRELAYDSAYAKADLRELFSKSPVWNEELQAIVINGTRTRNTDYERVYDLSTSILHPLYTKGKLSLRELRRVTRLFWDQDIPEDVKTDSIDIINRIAPGAYAPGKKPSRVFKAICKATGIADETAGSEFQRLYAQLADELSARKLDFKLYVSINPAHFLTMSNPKGDERGCTLTSCHSLNSTEYQYNNGCTGYARDSVSFIVFTAADDNSPETLNNRKTTRQIFAYRPGSGLLMQSRMYNTSGGADGAIEESKLYRDLVQREISALENAVNLWTTKPSAEGEYQDLVEAGSGFGGYPDWTFRHMNGRISCRIDCDPATVEPLVVGTYGLCVACGCETSEGVYCEDCDNTETCDECGEGRCELYDVIDQWGDRVRVCDDCLDNHYTCCDICGEYHHTDNMRYVDGRDVCNGCFEEYSEECEHCGERHLSGEMTEVHNENGDLIRVCEDCRKRDYSTCDDCGEYYPDECFEYVYNKYGSRIWVCEDCIEKYTECPDCGEHVAVCNDGTCPHCGVVMEEGTDAEVTKHNAIAEMTTDTVEFAYDNTPIAV